MTDLSLITESLDRISEILREPPVVAQLGYSHWQTEVEEIEAGRAGLAKYDPDARSHVARFENEKRLSVAGKAIDLAVIMLNRNGLQELKGVAWVGRDQRVVEAGMAAFDRETAYQRG